MLTIVTPASSAYFARVALLFAAAGFIAAACGASNKGMPEGLYGTWDGGNNLVSTVRFSDGGRIEMNNGACSGEYELSAIDGSVANLRTGYIRCDVMDGYIQGATATVDGDSLTITGPKINGSYERVG